MLIFAYPIVLYIGLPVLLLAFFVRNRLRLRTRYLYPRTGELARGGMQARAKRWVLPVLRLAALAALVTIAARPQLVDESSRISVDGVPMVLCLDVSGSMQLFDDLKDTRSRIEVAKHEALRFVERRPNDPIGLVLFGSEAISRCPLTLDKKLLRELINDTHLGIVDSQGTALGTGIATAVSRLKTSTAKSKVIILLTDGMPVGDSIAPDLAVELAQKFSIKIYTIGIGREGGGFMMGPFGTVQQASGDAIDMALLESIAQKTGGAAFRASNPKQLAAIYDKIDLLETSEQESPIFSRVQEAFVPLLWLVLLLILCELGLSQTILRGVSL